MKLHLGIIDVPYVGRETAAQMRRRVKKGEHPPAGAKTTGDVAEILEARYHIMEIFYEVHKAEIIGALEESVSGAIENLIAGAPINMAATGEGESKIKDLFSKFLSEKEMDRLGYPGVPTEAAKRGVNHRFKKGKGPKNRPSFIDTGLYETSFRAWVD